jgi:glycosyltransferase involved in cell wall biosynthesis
MQASPKILIFSPSAHGGLAEHTFYQGQALEQAGAKVVCLVPPAFLAGRKTSFEKVVCLADHVPAGSSRVMRKIKMAWDIIVCQLVLAIQIVKHRPDLVLLDSYVEYFSPVWVWPHWLLARLAGVKYAANLHDPVRSYVVGPLWWHRLSVRLAYLPLDFVLVHDKLPEPSPVPVGVKTVQVPVGVYDIAGPAHDASVIRHSWGVQAGQKIFLAFGYVRDGKNLDLAVRALASVPEVFLVVAGSVASTNDKPFGFYRDLAGELGVAGRCRFFEGFVADEELGKYFAGTDFVLLTYASSFHSQSGVLNIAARARKPVLASSAPSPLIESVKQFDLGIAVAPDSLAAVQTGMRQLIASPPSPRWQAYEASAAWAVNAHGILNAAGLLPASTATFSEKPVPQK